MNTTDLHVYRLVPDAPETDPQWDLAPSAGTVVVRAHSRADARIVAAEGEPDFPELDAKPGDGVRTRFASALRNEKLYRVEEIESDRYPTQGERGILEGFEAPSAAIKPLRD